MIVCGDGVAAEGGDIIFYCEKGIIKIDSRFCAPSTVTQISDGQEETIDFNYETRGYDYEIKHFNQLLRAGKTQSDIMTFDFSRKLIQTLDNVREIIGLKYTWFNILIDTLMKVYQIEISNYAGFLKTSKQITQKWRINLCCLLNRFLGFCLNFLFLFESYSIFLHPYPYCKSLNMLFFLFYNLEILQKEIF